MTRRPIRIALASLAALAIALPGGVLGAGAAAADQKVDGSMGITLSPEAVAQLFKAGVFVYNVSEVTVGMSDSGSLTIATPLDGQWKGKPATSVAQDPETGAATVYHGTAGTRIGIGSLAIRRTGSTGTVRAQLIGPYSMETGQQWSRTLTLFTMSKASGKQRRCGWSMEGTITLTPEAAAILNERLQTTVFSAAAPMGEASAGVGDCQP